jgi:glycerate kinase
MPTRDSPDIKVLIAPDSFKGSLTSQQAVDAIAAGILRAIPDANIDGLPLADGGEGTTDALLAATGGEKVPLHVTGPLGQPVDSFYGWLKNGETAVVEAAAACGLTQVPPQLRDPRITTSRGLGELLLVALRRKPKRIIVGIGGSATNDGGSGLLRALGARFLDDCGAELPEGGAALRRLSKLDLTGWSWPDEGPEILIASDVKNPLCGEQGASAVFGPQKGATPERVRELDEALAHFARISAQTLSEDYSKEEGAGAAGGIGFALMAFLNGKMQPGVELVLEAASFSARASRADLIVTGEGRLDAQTGMGKAVLGVARAGKAAGKPVVALAGSLTGNLEALRDEGLSAAMSIAVGPCDLEEMMENADTLLTDASERMMRWIMVGRRLAGEGEDA